MSDYASKQLWLKKFIKPGEHEKITAAVKKAEAHTTCEIVPMIVHRSSIIGHVQIALIMSCGLIYFFIETILTEFSWPSSYHQANIILLILNIISSFYFAKRRYIQRLFLHSKDLNFQVWERAEIEFYRHGITKTKYSTGILLFVSLMERQAVVLADKAIAKKLPTDTWQNVINVLVDGIKNNDATRGFEKAIAMCGEILASHFPAEHKNPDELTNHLIVKE